MIVKKFGNYLGVNPDIVKALAVRAGACQTCERASSRAFSKAVVECSFANPILMRNFQGRMEKLIHCQIRQKGSEMILSVPCLQRDIIESIPEFAQRLIACNSFIGISGDRNKSIQIPTLHALSTAISLMWANTRVHVGDCSGIDRAARRLLYLQNVSLAAGSRVKVKVHRVANKYNKREFVARSIRCINAVGDGLWLSFPQHPCPDGIVPARKWIGGGKSGTWASLALAAGLGLDCLVFCPVHFPTAGEWAKFHPCGDGWYAIRDGDSCAARL